MAELKRIRVREARARDVGLFKKLWAESLEQQAKEGSILAASEKTLEAYERLFNVYVEGEFEGIVLFVADKGVLMWGDAGSPMDYSLGKMITAWGLHVSPESPDGIQAALQQHAEEWAKERGFEGILVDSYRESAPMEGFEPVVTVLHRAIE